MSSLEKSMFFIPNRYVAKNRELFVSFNLAQIPKDMVVTSMMLHLPLPAHSTMLSLSIKEITTGWSEKSVRAGRKPLHPRSIATVSSAPYQAEELVNLLAFQHKWRFNSLSNHGVYVKLLSPEAGGFSQNTPPYLVLDSI